VKIEIEVW